MEVIGFKYLPTPFSAAQFPLIKLLSQRARCYEYLTATVDVFPEWFEQQVTPGSEDEYSEDICSRLYYKVFARIRRPPIEKGEETSMADSSSLNAEPKWAAFAAIDWADQKHFWKLLPAGTNQPEEGELENTPEAVERWAVGLQAQFAGRPIALCIEQSRGALVYMLAKYEHLVLSPCIPPLRLVIEKPSAPPVQRTILTTQPLCLICYFVIVIGYGNCARTLLKLVCCSS